MEKLIFVYNADSGLINGVKDYLHKIKSPETYECNLCAVTFGNMGMKNEWKKFLKKLDLPTEFLHKNEFNKKFSLDAKLPAVFLKKNEKMELLISSSEINKCGTVVEMIDLVKSKLKAD